MFCNNKSPAYLYLPTVERFGFGKNDLLNFTLINKSQQWECASVLKRKGQLRNKTKQTHKQISDKLQEAIILMEFLGIF